MKTFLHNSAKYGSCGLYPSLLDRYEDVVLQLSINSIKEWGVVIISFVILTLSHVIQTQFGVGFLPNHVISSSRQSTTRRWFEPIGVGAEKLLRRGRGDSNVEVHHFAFL